MNDDLVIAGAEGVFSPARPSRADKEGLTYSATFHYVAPTTLDEALAVLEEHGDEEKVLADGQSLSSPCATPGPARPPSSSGLLSGGRRSIPSVG
jgi:hypothetical protein